VGLARGGHRLPGELVRVIEGMALARPLPSVAGIHRRLVELASIGGRRGVAWGGDGHGDAVRGRGIEAVVE